MNSKKTRITTSLPLFDYKIFAQSKVDLLNVLEKNIAADIFTTLFTPNAEQIVQANHDITFKKNLQQADILIPDGMSVVLALKFMMRLESKKQRGYKEETIQLERIAGADVVEELLKKAEKKNWKVAIIGGHGYEEVSRSSNVVWTSGYQSISNPTKKEESAVISFIKEHKPDIVLVAFGAPHQEQWIIEHCQLLEESGVKLAMAVGGSLDFMTGQVSRAPEWMQKSGLEWLYRLIKQPWRWRRQLRLFEFWWMVLHSFA